MAKDKRLKILFIASHYPEKRSPLEGIFTREHAKAASLYNQITVLYSGEKVGNQKKLWCVVSDKEEGGVSTIRVKHKISSISKFFSYFLYLSSIFFTFRKLRKENGKPDIIHAHIYVAGVPAVILGKIYHIPVVLTVHSSTFPRRALRPNQKRQARFAINNADLVLPVSNFLKKSIGDYGFKNEFQVVPNTIDTKLFSLLLNGKKSKKKEILTITSFKPKKGNLYLLEALSIIKNKRNDFCINIIGDSPEKKEYEEMVNNLQLQDFVKFCGFKRKKEVVHLIRQCDFLVSPSLFETFGVSIIEALACGKPIVATKSGGPNEIIDKKVGVLAATKNSEDLAKSIDYMLDHYQDYSPERLANYAQENFSYEKVGWTLNRIYRKLIKNKQNNYESREEKE